jgi:hypothetical protein
MHISSEWRNDPGPAATLGEKGVPRVEHLRGQAERMQFEEPVGGWFEHDAGAVGSSMVWAPAMTTFAPPAG